MMNDYMVSFPPVNGHAVAVPLSSGVAWYGGNARLWIVDSGRKGRKRYAVCRDNGMVIVYAKSMDEARTLCCVTARI